MKHFSKMFYISVESVYKVMNVMKYRIWEITITKDLIDNNTPANVKFANVKF